MGGMIDRQKYFVSKRAFAVSGSLVCRCKVSSPWGESIEYGESPVVNVEEAIPFMLENIRIQCTFGHLNKTSDKENGWRIYYNSSGDVIDDIGDDIHVMVLSHYFKYPRYDNARRFRYRTIKGKRYLVVERRMGDKHRQEHLFSVKGKLKRSKDQVYL